MNRHLNVLVPSELLAALDAFAAERGCNRSAATRLIIQYVIVDALEFYEPPTLPSWQIEAWTLLLRGLFGDERLVLTDEIESVLRDAVAALNGREHLVLCLRFGLDGLRLTGTEVAAIMGWEGGRQRAHQVETLALRRVRGWCRVRGIWDLLKGQLDKEEYHEKPGLSNSQ